VGIRLFKEFTTPGSINPVNSSSAVPGARVVRIKTYISILNPQSPSSPFTFVHTISLAFEEMAKARHANFASRGAKERVLGCFWMV